MLFPYNGKKPKNLTAETILCYAGANVIRFQNLLIRATEGDPSVRPHECKAYLEVWREVLAADGQWDKLSLEARNEVMDEYQEENFDM